MTSRQNGALSRTRPKKLQSRQHIQIVREDQVDQVAEFDAGRAPIDTGVEKAEEAEYHLQQAIKASQADKEDAKLRDAYIPTPPTIASDIQYDVLYPKGWEQPSSYIRFSETVEDCAGTPYCMDEEDELALKLMNAKLPSSQSHITEDQFEEVMGFFEESAQIRQPFAAVDSPPVLSLEELQEQFNDTHAEYVRTLSALIYDHWAIRRGGNSNRGLCPHLKFETGQESDDSDPYVCFRRRELRQIRKTRNRDVQSGEKLRKLRMEQETARNVLLLVSRRERMKQETVQIDRQVFTQRHAFRETKRKLNIKGDDELLVNQKKQKVTQGMTPNQAALAQQLRMPGMSHGASSHDLRTLEEVEAEKSRSIRQEIALNVEKHGKWNEGFVDRTKAPLTPEPELDIRQPGGFREAMPATEYLPTPPASTSEQDEQEKEGGETAVDLLKDSSRSSTPFRYASPVEDSDGAVPMPSFRRRIGRGGRLHFDRRMPSFRQPWKKDLADIDKFRFDSDNSESDEDDLESHQAMFARMAQRAHLATPAPPRPDAAQQALINAHRQKALEAAAAGQSSATPTISVS